MLRNAGRLLAPDGRLVPYGVGHSFEHRVDRAAGPSQWNLMFIGPSEERAHEYILQLLRMQLLTPSTFFSHRMPFDRLADGFELLRDGKAIKVVFDMEDAG
jgi:threonine dehydrogenase-like Zn-dependent dehydrogenase